MDSARLQKLNDKPFAGKSVVYVMSRDQRVRDNHALFAAQQSAIEHSVPLYVLFVLKHVKGRSREQYQFMCDGLKELSQSLASHNIAFVLRIGDATLEIPRFAKEVQAGALFFDFSPLYGPRAVAQSVVKTSKISVAVVDTHNIIPVWVASPKQEFAAHTMRGKVHKLLAQFLIEPNHITTHPVDFLQTTSASFNEAQSFVKNIPSSSIVVAAASGEKAAAQHLEYFITNKIAQYATGRNEIAEDHQSGLSPYLHFGQLSSLRIALEVMNAVSEAPLLLRQSKLATAGDSPRKVDGMNTLLEELIVRKELADNFCFYNKHYKSLDGAPDWARTSLALHQKDPREFMYTRSQWEAAATHDDIWNAAQSELGKTGKLHGYMRMYWAKKMLEWSASAEEAIATAIYLNDKYSIDGGDPNGYVGILWSIAGLHDRPWFERNVYGKIRYMNAAGLRRKFDVDAYIARVSH